MLRALFTRDVQLAFTQSALAALGFFILVVLIFVLSSTGNIEPLALGLIWSALLLAHLLFVPFFFEDDLASGALELMLIEIKLPALLIVIKSLALWVGASLPLIIVMLFVAHAFNLTTASFVSLVVTMSLGSLGLVFLNGFAAALTCGLRSSAWLAPFIILPLQLPILIFGVSACRASVNLFWQSAPFMILIGLVLFVFATVPAFAAIALQTEE
jgi:heme exporter protein B